MLKGKGGDAWTDPADQMFLLGAGKVTWGLQACSSSRWLVFIGNGVNSVSDPAVGGI